MVGFQITAMDQIRHQANRESWSRVTLKKKKLMTHPLFLFLLELNVIERDYPEI